MSTKVSNVYSTGNEIEEVNIYQGRAHSRTPAPILMLFSKKKKSKICCSLWNAFKKDSWYERQAEIAYVVYHDAVSMCLDNDSNGLGAQHTRKVWEPNVDENRTTRRGPGTSR